MNDTSINCFDGEYSKEQLKELSEQNLLKCPICGKVYEYCHGRVNNPYFRHKDKVDCNIKYQESETPEHIKGKIDLFNWVKGLDGVTDVQLEQYIPETDQCADVGFKYGGKQYVIEYQCSPIATEYFERHELYESVGIEDIWICGTDKYFVSSKKMRGSTIEKNSGWHFDVDEKVFVYWKDKESEECIYPITNTIPFFDSYTEILQKEDKVFYSKKASAVKINKVLLDFENDNCSISVDRFGIMDDIFEKVCHRKQMRNESYSHSKTYNFQKIIRIMKGYLERHNWLDTELSFRKSCSGSYYDRHMGDRYYYNYPNNISICFKAQNRYPCTVTVESYESIFSKESQTELLLSFYKEMNNPDMLEYKSVTHNIKGGDSYGAK